MTNWALENSLPAGEAQALEEAYANDEPQLVEKMQVSSSCTNFQILRGTFWHLFTHLYDYCNSESLGVRIEFEFGQTDDAKFVQYCHGDDDEAPDRYLRQWPRIELRTPEGMIEKSLRITYTRRCQMNGCPQVQHTALGGAAVMNGRAVPFGAFNVHTAALFQNFLNMESTPWQMKISWPD